MSRIPITISILCLIGTIFGLGRLLIALLTLHPRNVHGQKLTNWHHGYLGPLGLLPLLWPTWPPPTWVLWVAVAAVLILHEDAHQHDKQIADPTYLSPLHIYYERFVRWLLNLINRLVR